MFLYTFISPSGSWQAPSLPLYENCGTTPASLRAGLPLARSPLILTTLVSSPGSFCPPSSRFRRRLRPVLRLGLGQLLIGVCSAGPWLFQHKRLKIIWALFIHDLSAHQPFDPQGALVSSPSVDSLVCRRKHTWLDCTQHKTKTSSATGRAAEVNMLLFSFDMLQNKFFSEGPSEKFGLGSHRGSQKYSLFPTAAHSAHADWAGLGWLVWLVGLGSTKNHHKRTSLLVHPPPDPPIPPRINLRAHLRDRGTATGPGIGGWPPTDFFAFHSATSLST